MTIHDSGSVNGFFYFVMDHIAGRPLDRFVSDRKLSVDACLELFGKICEAVNAAHLRGVIHRDLKPSNILVDDAAEPHVLDFGLAKMSLDGEAETLKAVTVTGQFLGSVPWASPEQADLKLVTQFGAFAIVAAFAGVYALKLLSAMPEIVAYPLAGSTAVVTPLKLAMAILMVGFAVVELHPRFEKLEIDRRYLPLGGVLSGFFGGLSGHQGALRSAFLAKVGITAEAFVGTNAVIGLLVDLVRITAYGAILFGGSLPELAGSREGGLVLAGTLAAFAGVIVGKRFLRKITMATVQRTTGAMLMLIAFLLGLGLI